MGVEGVEPVVDALSGPNALNVNLAWGVPSAEGTKISSAALVPTVHELDDVDQTFCGVAGDAVLDAVIRHDRDWLLEGERDLQDILLLADVVDVSSDSRHGVATGRAEALLEVVRGALRRLVADEATAKVTPGSVDHRMLLALRDGPGLTNRALADALSVDETQISRAGRKLEELALAWKRRLGRTNYWELTPRGYQAIASLGIGVPMQAANLKHPVDTLRGVQQAFLSITEPGPDPAVLTGSELARQVEGEAELPRAVAEDGVRRVLASPLVDPRRKEALALRQNQPCAVGVSLDAESLVAVLVDASAQTLGVPLRRRLDSQEPEAVAAQVASMALELLDPYGSVEPLGLGVELPGHVDGWRGEVRLSPELRSCGKAWRDVDFGQLLKDATGFSAVAVENDANALALYELHFGLGRRYLNFSTVLLTDRGLGAGIVLGGELLRGEDGVAGEFGHIPLGRPAVTCRCGRKGCLETDLTELLAEIGSTSSPRKAAQLASQTGELLGRGLAVLLNLLPGDHVVVFGRGMVFEEGTPTCASFRSAARRAVENCGFSSTSLVEPAWTNDSREHRACGAAAALLGRYRPSDLPEPSIASDLLDGLERWGTVLTSTR